MESIGERLKGARERNNLTLDQIARDTHVAKRFLKALEDEDFSVFPGETYVMGFLRNYSDYLGLNAEELIGAYRNIKIQEQPLPMNELLESKPKYPPLLVVLAAVAAALVLLATGYLVYRAASRGAGPVAGVQRTAAGEREQFVFQDEVRTKWFAVGDVISVPLSGKDYQIQVSAVGDNLTLKVPGGTVDLGLGKERYIDLQGDSHPDIKIVWNDVDRTSPQKRVNLGLYRTTGQAADAAAAAAAAAGTGTSTGAPAGVSPGGTTTQGATAPGAAGPAGAGTSAPAASTAPVAAVTPPVRGADFSPVAIMKTPDSGVFTLGFTFKNDCLFRFLVDDKDREDRFFQKGEQFSIESVHRQVTIWLSNAGSTRMRVDNKDFELGALGEVATRKIAWRKDPAATGYVLEITALY
ncbi:MAG TPA: helix-turn-helix domain-containing protein [Spirochaetia bacterium]|nr:helix-turn-helix domain-containing protein [Spirochaetia bacterium]